MAEAETPPLPSTQNISHYPHLPSRDGIPLWSGDDPNYSVFTFLRRVKEALAPFPTLTGKEKVNFLRSNMNCDTLTASGAVLEDDFYSNCTDFESFCSNLIKEFACAYEDPCLASLTNFIELLSSNSGLLSPRVAAGLAGRFRTEFDHSLTHSRWLNDDATMSKENILSLFSYVLYANTLTPDAAALTRDMSFQPTSTIHDLKLAAEAKLRHKPERLNTIIAPPPPPPPARSLPPSPPTPPPQRASLPQSNHPHRPPKYASQSVPHRDIWCHYHKTPSHSSAQCNFLRAQRQRKQQDFCKGVGRP